MQFECQNRALNPHKTQWMRAQIANMLADSALLCTKYVRERRATIIATTKKTTDIVACSKVPTAYNLQPVYL